METALTSGPWSLYTGLQSVSYATETDVDYEDSWIPATYHTTRHWRQSDRLIIGTRFSSSDLSRHRPVIGLGISWGWYRRSKTVQHNSSSYEYSIHQVSKGSFGIAGELGYLIPVHRRLTVSILGRLDVINSQTGYEELRWMPKADNLYLGNIQLGLQYHFRRASGE